MESKFCSDCRWIEFYANGRGEKVHHHCKAPQNLALVTEVPVHKTWLEVIMKKVGEVLSPEKKNKFNNCDWFEKHEPAIHKGRFGLD